ncbi:cytochrome P450 [Schizopora paradoxa]|uniref:Cytochrome P450 n=1 Tax=Schizopora paradoxa TaxID=27342 RepID=A0A0H2R2H8_9AGAM|nr:cytochrome P450 [Schizopora paradoxa]
MLLIQHLCGWAWVTSMIPYGDSLRKQRAILHRFFQFPEVLNYKELQERECHLFLRRLVDSPENYDRHIRRLPASILGLNTYGHEVKDDNDRYLELGEESAEMTIEAVNYLYLDFLPWMRFLPAWFPGGSFQKFVEESRKLSTLFRNEIYALNKNKRTITTLMNFVLAMLKYPEVQRRAQEEIDVVVGNDRLPTFKDRAQLPYIRALCLELLRWQAILPLGFIHTAAEEDVYHGYRIPAGTMVIPNVWAISRNEDIYPKPLDFIPERWLPGGSSLNSFRPDEYVFGYGRRICPGQVWAEHMIFIAVVSILEAFKIEKALDSDGEPIPPNENHKPAAIRLLGPSECMIAPRSEKIASMICDCAGTLS